MENIVAYGQGEALPGTFTSDPLAPCDDAEPRHQWGCYINQAPYLVRRYDGYWDKVVGACMDAVTPMRPVCIFNAGQITVDPLWHTDIIPPWTETLGLPMIPRAARLCASVPGGFANSCINGAIEYLLQYGKDADALAFCKATDAPLQEGCYQEMGQAWQERSPLPDDPCAVIPATQRAACLRGLHEPVHFPDEASFSRWSRLAAAVRRWIRTGERDLLRIIGRLPTLFRRPSKISALIVHYNGDHFSPQTVSVEQGQTVEWVNDSRDTVWPASNDHPTHLKYPAFDPKKPIKSGDAWSFAFDREGRWGYHNHLYPTETGAVIVGK